MTISYVGSSSAFDNDGSVSLTIPGGTVRGDFILVSYKAQASFISFPGTVSMSADIYLNSVVSSWNNPSVQGNRGGVLGGIYLGPSPTIDLSWSTGATAQTVRAIAVTYRGPRIVVSQETGDSSSPYVSPSQSTEPSSSPGVLLAGIMWKASEDATPADPGGSLLDSEAGLRVYDMGAGSGSSSPISWSFSGDPEAAHAWSGWLQEHVPQVESTTVADYPIYKLSGSYEPVRQRQRGDKHDASARNIGTGRSANGSKFDTKTPRNVNHNSIDSGACGDLDS